MSSDMLTAAATWRLAKSLIVFRAEVDALRPNRSRISDGTIGDADHASRTSDHNPWVPPPTGGVVTAIDITDDGGTLGRIIAEHLRRSRDPRIKYVIFEGVMFSSYATSSHSAWTWRPYGGPNPHNTHLHLSVNVHNYDEDVSWGIHEPATQEDAMKLGDTGEDVAAWQSRLRDYAGITSVVIDGERKDVAVDGDFGPITEAATRRWQKMAGLTRSGVVSLMTAALLIDTRSRNELTEHERRGAAHTHTHAAPPPAEHTHPELAAKVHGHTGTVTGDVSVA